MNWYSIHGTKAVDMCNNTEDVFLGIIQLPDDRDTFQMERKGTGMHVVNNEWYLEINFYKIQERTLDQLQGYWTPPHLRKTPT